LARPREGPGREALHVGAFEDREQLDVFSQNPKESVRRRIAGAVGRTVLLIDEAQYAPELGQKLKLLYDLFPDVKMVVTGSSSLELKNQTGRFLVGRMFEFELMPDSRLWESPPPPFSQDLLGEYENHTRWKNPK
jgi:predicted AAA+ superfamily ATPase